MSVCPTVSVLRFYEWCHPCLLAKLRYQTKRLLQRPSPSRHSTFTTFIFCLLSYDTLKELMSVYSSVLERQFYECCHPCLIKSDSYSSMTLVYAFYSILEVFIKHWFFNNITSIWLINLFTIGKYHLLLATKLLYNS